MRVRAFSIQAVLTVGLLFSCLLCSAGAAPATPVSGEKQALADEIDFLWKHVLGPRFPACVEKEKGGFHTTYARDWTPLPDRGRFIVYEARVVGRRRPWPRLRPAKRTSTCRTCDTG